ncbi:MAG: hypothetical protein IK012_03180, partial [Fibrobacter sp.]|uniref:hypothetical protein n=1 Tax=Fibrobacter sp. TaxID=35828 RepID=UPI0025B8EB0C
MLVEDDEEESADGETELAVLVESADSFCSGVEANAEIEKAADSPKRATSFALVLGLSSPSFLTMRFSMCMFLLHSFA